VGRIENMTAYVISDVVGLDPGLVAQYRAFARDSIQLYDGQYLTPMRSVVGDGLPPDQTTRIPDNS
jgi:uncharacterized protein (DUF1330 family)